MEYMNNKRPFMPSLPNVLEPSKLLLPTDLTKPCLPDHAIQPDCIHQTNDFFQCFSAVPKPHFTLRMGVVSVWAINPNGLCRELWV